MLIERETSRDKRGKEKEKEKESDWSEKDSDNLEFHFEGLQSTAERSCKPRNHASQ